MFVKKFFTYLISQAHISESKRCVNVKSSTYYFLMKTKILADFQICISVSLIEYNVRNIFLEKSYTKCGGEMY